MQFKDSAYRIASSDSEDNIVIPVKLLPELRKLPDDVLSFPRAIDKVSLLSVCSSDLAKTVQSMETKYTKIDTESHLIIQSVRSDLTPALGTSTCLS